jgi:ubiquinone/menaquinone biosynthesis C-methylase UbiE
MTTEPTQTWVSAEAAKRWRLSAAQRQQAVGAITELMLDSIDLRPGQRVLDLAAGTGDTSILVSKLVGPAGSVLAVDISAAMLAEAEKAAGAEGLTNIQMLVSDIVHLDLPPQTFDAAISRFGLMFLTDIVEGLRRIRSALKSGSRLAAAVWSTEAHNPHIHIPLQVAEQLGQAPPEDSPLRRTVSLGRPGAFERALEQAGYVGIMVQAVPIPRQFDSIDAAVSSMRETSTLLRQLFGTLERVQQQHVLNELRQRLAYFSQSPDERCILPGEALLGVASAP